MSQPEHEETQRAKTRAPWERPSLTVIGHVKDLVQAGKAGSGFDADSGGSFKATGIG